MVLYIIFSFMFWLIDFQFEYLGSDIYFNFYLQGCVLLMSAQLMIAVYDTLGVRTLLQISCSIIMPTCAFMIALNKRWFSFGHGPMNDLLIAASVPISLLLLSLSC